VFTEQPSVARPGAASS